MCERARQVIKAVWLFSLTHRAPSELLFPLRLRRCVPFVSHMTNLSDIVTRPLPHTAELTAQQLDLPPSPDFLTLQQTSIRLHVWVQPLNQYKLNGKL